MRPAAVRSGTWRAATPGLPGGLAPWEVTLAETLSDAGYATAMSGKWHVTHNLGEPRKRIEPAERTNWPVDRGFDWFYGTIHGAGSFFDPVTLARGNDYIERDRDDFHYTVFPNFHVFGGHSPDMYVTTR